MTTISASRNYGIKLGSGSYTSPVVIATGITITNPGYPDVAYTGSGSTTQFTIQNAGTIVNASNSSGDGVYLSPGGSVTNAVSGSISGYLGVDMSGGAGTVVNDGTIAATGSYSIVSFHDSVAVDLQAGGSVTNADSASITGLFGVKIGGNSATGAGTVFNDGYIAGPHGEAVYVYSGSVTNASAGSITGLTGVIIVGNGATVVNDGSIVGTENYGVHLEGEASLTNGASGSITGGYWGVGLYAGGMLTNAGTIVGAGIVGNGGGAAVVFGGTGSNVLVLDPGYSFTGAVMGSASASNTMELASAASVGTVAGLGTEFRHFGAIEFDAGAKWSVAGVERGLAGPITGFAAGDTIELTGVTATGSIFVGNTLTLDEAGGSTTLDLPGSFSTTSFDVTNVAGGVDVTLAPPCFCAGTRIACLDGERAVETLLPGEFVRVAGTEHAEITWIGHRHVDCARHPKPADVWPVRVRAGAFAAGAPQRDLWLSPDHAVFVDDVLIPIRYLINGRTIAQERVDAVTYYHVELSDHEVILAEGLPCESYLDTGNRAAFADVPRRLAGLARPWQVSGLTVTQLQCDRTGR